MEKITEIFGMNVFNETVMKERLPKGTYLALKQTMEQGKELDPAVAEVIAGTMKDWAIEKGATHFTHWFQPMTGITAEKHDSFIAPTKDGKVIMEFSGKELIKGEPDASSFPSGGLRATFEARGYTAWDCTSPAFIKDQSLCIPTAFCSYRGEALDKKTPLLRSMEAISKEAVKLLRIFGNTTVKRVITEVGPEQEYFLIDKKMFDKRQDLIFTGRTLFGAKPAKGQEMDDHYFGSLKERISDFMKDVDKELWKLGITAKTKHNEAAPAQHELAPIYNTTNIATDHNQLIMDVMQKTALRHGMVCLLHEKPFARLNGSGKHNNWSLSTDDGQNLLDPGKTPHENAQFLVFLCAVIKAVDSYPELLRLSASNPGNDRRLGANEAPPAIISIFLGEQLTNILLSLANGEHAVSESKETLKIGVSTLPTLPKDSTDRNRTSPFAFTGNKFEFRMVPSSASIACPNYILNTIVAESLSQISAELEKADDLSTGIKKVIKDIMNKHRQIIFNGNNYCSEWMEEAKRRGLPDITNMVDACKAFVDPKNIAVLEKHNVLSKDEMHARYEILLETYCKTIRIEGMTAVEMVKKQILPACMKYAEKLASGLVTLQKTGLNVSTKAQEKILIKVTELCEQLYDATEDLEHTLSNVESGTTNSYELGCAYRDKVITSMDRVRFFADDLETIVDKELWPLPTYELMLFNF